jgi:prepilin-type N-terminal cleavage/methylation domain-containing protein
MKDVRTDQSGKRDGFSLVEVLVGVALMAIALLGLAQVFLISIMQNARSDRMTNAAFLAQQQIEQLRTLTGAELNTMVSTPMDETLDLNADGINDYRRITYITYSADAYQVRVLVFSGEIAETTAGELLGDPDRYKARIDVTTVITR